MILRVLYRVYILVQILPVLIPVLRLRLRFDSVASAEYMIPHVRCLRSKIDRSKALIYFIDKKHLQDELLYFI